jgi:tetratricopeptide (TPR) repeat protein/tRNA A-37 threonylcarbamoyl transferase component Bud32
MGVVYRVRDPDLHRTLALKVLRPEYRNNPELVRRFREEAQITAQLQHPAIPPIHQVGTLADGRPFLAMKLIRGRTLAELLHERPQPSHDLPRFLAIFGQVCQALAYAHSEGVIHRDLKPSNVMVGAFGEVQVMDWGLAKVLQADRRQASAPRVEESSAITTVRTAAGMSSRAGAVLGTPAYMAPEQARGEVENLDERCDVFGLGAILCVILTGQPPYTESDCYVQARQGLLSSAHARLNACGADAELVSLARSCLEPDRSQRLRHAGVVALAVADYQAQVQEKLGQAEVERAQAQIKASEERKRRRLSLALMGALLVPLLGGGGAASWWFQHQAVQEAEEAKQAAAEAERKVAQAVRQERVKGEIRVALSEAGQLLKRARELSSNLLSWQATLQTARSAVKRAEVLLTEEPQLASEGLAQAVRQNRENLEVDEKDRVLVAAFEDILKRLHFKTSDGESDEDPQLPANLHDLQEALTAWGLSPTGAPAERLAAFLRQRPQGIRDRLTTILYFYLSWLPAPEEDRRQSLTRVLLAAETDPWRQKVLKAAASRSVALLQKLADEADVARQAPIFLTGLALSRLIAGKPASLALLRRAQQAHPQDFRLNLELARALLRSVLPEDFVEVARREDLPVVSEAVRFYTAALAVDPDNPTLHVEFGDALRARGELAAAIAAYKKALEIDPKLAPGYTNLGNALQAQGDLKGAVGCYRKAIEIDPRLAHPHGSLGVALQTQGDVEGAIACYHKALQLNPRLAKVHYNLGDALRQKKDWTGAIACYTKARDLDPRDARIHNNLGIVLQNHHDLPGAIASFRKALELDPKLAPAQMNLGLALFEKKDLDGAIACYRKALEFDPKYALANHNLGNALYFRGEVGKAIACYQKAVELDPKLAPAHHNLGAVLAGKGDLDGAIACYHKAIAVDPRYVAAHSSLGSALARRGDQEGALACFRKAIDLDPKYAPVHYNLGRVLKARGDLDGAIACYQKALKLEANHVSALRGLGEALLGSGRFAQAQSATRRALDLLPPGHPLRTPTAKQLQQCEQLLKLDARLPGILKGDEQPTDAADQLQLADLCQRYKQQYAAAARFYEGAFAAGAALTAPRSYNAACAAALAAAGQGKDSGPIPDKEKARLRQQARAWLQEALKIHQEQLKDADGKGRAALQQSLQHWQQDADLAGVRGEKALAHLPEAERAAWQQLWAEVETLRKKTQESTK